MLRYNSSHLLNTMILKSAPNFKHLSQFFVGKLLLIKQRIVHGNFGHFYIRA